MHHHRKIVVAIVATITIQINKVLCASHTHPHHRHNIWSQCHELYKEREKGRKRKEVAVSTLSHGHDKRKTRHWSILEL